MPRVDPESLAKVEEALKLYTAEVERQVGLTSSTKDTYFGRSLLSGWLSISTTTAGAAPPSKVQAGGTLQAIAVTNLREKASLDAPPTVCHNSSLSRAS